MPQSFPSKRFWVSVKGQPPRVAMFSRAVRAPRKEALVGQRLQDVPLMAELARPISLVDTCETTQYTRY